MKLAQIAIPWQFFNTPGQWEADKTEEVLHRMSLFQTDVFYLVVGNKIHYRKYNATLVKPCANCKQIFDAFGMSVKHRYYIDELKRVEGVTIEELDSSGDACWEDLGDRIATRLRKVLQDYMSAISREKGMSLQMYYLTSIC